MKLDSMKAIKAVAREVSNPWFDRETMSFFDSRVSDKVYPASDGSCYFVSSERFDAQSPRLYTVRRAFCDEYGEFHIQTVGEFQGFNTRETAHRSAKLSASNPFVV